MPNEDQRSVREFRLGEHPYENVRRLVRHMQRRSMQPGYGGSIADHPKGDGWAISSQPEGPKCFVNVPALLGRSVAPCVVVMAVEAMH